MFAWLNIEYVAIMQKADGIIVQIFATGMKMYPLRNKGVMIFVRFQTWNSLKLLRVNRNVDGIRWIHVKRS
jgi:hypothetical protein